MGYICVVGGATVDIMGKSATPLKIRDSNPGTLTLSAGGVGRNIAENLARLGNKAVMLTALGNDANSLFIEKNAAETGIDLSHSLRVDFANCATYMCLVDSNGDMFIGMSDMMILQHLTPAYLATKLDVLNAADCVVCDTNIPQCLAYLQRNVTTPLFLDTVSAKKTAIAKNDIKNVFCIKPNVYEAEVLTGIAINSDKDFSAAANKLHGLGISWVVISCGENGVYFSDGSGVHKMPSLASTVVNATGAGDSFVAGLVHGFVRNYGIEECVKLGSLASSITISAESTVSEKMSQQLIGQMRQELKI